MSAISIIEAAGWVIAAWIGCGLLLVAWCVVDVARDRRRVRRMRRALCEAIHQAQDRESLAIANSGRNTPPPPQKRLITLDDVCDDDDVFLGDGLIEALRKIQEEAGRA